MGDATAPSGPSATWASPVVLGNGDTVYIRPLTPDDQPALAAFHRRQSSASVYRRFFSPKPELSQRELDYFTDVDMVDRAALVVESHNEMIAWASYERWAGRNEAEAAFMVDDDHQGHGVATLLLEHLAAIARTNGITHFTAEVLGENRAMLGVFAKAGWPLQRRFESGVVDLDWSLADTDEYLGSVERREQRADSQAVARLLMPRAIAVIGASERPGSLGSMIWRNVTSSVDVPVHAVNPHRDSVHGHPCLRSISALPADVSLAIVVVPAHDLDRTIDECIEQRMRGAVVVTAVDGTEVDVVALVARARRNGLRIIGPASMGIASPHADTLIQAALVEVTLPSGSVAISMQSGSLGGSLLRAARDAHLGVSWFVSLGDKGDISGNDLLQFWEHDDHTSVIAMYTESFGNPRKFARIARRVSRSKPIVAVRTGAAASAALGGPLYQQAGLIEVPTVPALLDTVRVLATQPVLAGRRVAIITNSRSPGTLAAAALNTAGLDSVPAPIELDWTATPADYPAAMRAALGHAEVDGLLVIYAPAVEADVAIAGQAIHEGATDTGKPVVAVLLGGQDGPVIPGSRVPAFTFPEQAATVLGRSFAYARWRSEEDDAPPPVTRTIDPAAARDIIAAAVNAAAIAGQQPPLELAIDDCQRLLGTYGIAMTASMPSAPDRAVGDAAAIGYPVALKAVHRRPGRSTRAGVALDLSTEADVRLAVATMTESLGADAAELIVQAMVPPGIDVRIHCQLDEQLGPIVSVGLGGAQAEVIGDHASRLAPMSPASASSMVRETRLAAALDGAGLDSHALVQAVVDVGRLASDHPAIAEIDLNPVIVAADAAMVVDATIRLVPHESVEGPLRRLT